MFLEDLASSGKAGNAKYPSFEYNLSSSKLYVSALVVGACIQPGRMSPT
jgi:hypothetical protein